MFKIALPIKNGNTCSLFEQCKEFRFFTIEKKKITDVILISPPGLQAGQFPIWLFKNGVTDVLAYRINHETINNLNRLKINVFVGIKTKNPHSLISEFLEGNIETNPKLCESP